MDRESRPLQKEEKETYHKLLQSCLAIDPRQDEKKLFFLKDEFLKSSQNLHKQIAAFHSTIAEIPYSFLVVLWGEQLLAYDKMFGKRYVGMLCDLVDAGLLIFVDQEKTFTLQDLSVQDPSLIIETIRCHKEWSIHKREDYVLLYQAFSAW